jgi:hypothetical protein
MLLLRRLPSRTTPWLRAAIGSTQRCASTMPPPLEYASSCILPTDWQPLPLLARRDVSHDAAVYDFGLPAGKSLDLPVCACLLMRAPDRAPDGSDAIRPCEHPTRRLKPLVQLMSNEWMHRFALSDTPISDTSVTGKFELLVRRYPDGAASEWLHGLPVGSMVDFKHIAFNVKEPYPFAGKRNLTMIAGGSGIVLPLQRTNGAPTRLAPLALVAATCIRR